MYSLQNVNMNIEVQKIKIIPMLVGYSHVKTPSVLDYFLTQGRYASPPSVDSYGTILPLIRCYVSLALCGAHVFTMLMTRNYILLLHICLQLR